MCIHTYAQTYNWLIRLWWPFLSWQKYSLLCKENCVECQVMTHQLLTEGYTKFASTFKYQAQDVARPLCIRNNIEQRHSCLCAELMFQSLHLPQRLSSTQVPVPSAWLSVLKNWKNGREALTLHSTHLGPGCCGSARVGGILWGTVHSHCMFPQKTCHQRGSISDLKTKSGLSLCGMTFWDIRNVLFNLDQWLWYQGVIDSLPLW